MLEENYNKDYRDLSRNPTVSSAWNRTQIAFVPPQCAGSSQGEWAQKIRRR